MSLLRKGAFVVVGTIAYETVKSLLKTKSTRKAAVTGLSYTIAAGKKVQQFYETSKEAVCDLLAEANHQAEDSLAKEAAQKDTQTVSVEG